MKRTLSTRQVLELIDSLQAIHPNINDALGGVDSSNLRDAMERVSPLMQASIAVIIKLQAQFEENYPVVKGSELKVLADGFLPPKRVNKTAEIELTDDDWAFVDKWNGKYRLCPGQDYISACVEEA